MGYDKKTWDDLIKNAEAKYGKDSNLAKFWKETKNKDLIKKNKRFEDIYFDRPVAFHKDDK